MPLFLSLAPLLIHTLGILFSIKLYNLHRSILRVLLLFGFLWRHQSPPRKLKKHFLLLKLGCFIIWQIQFFSSQEIKKVQQLCLRKDQFVGLLEQAYFLFFHCINYLITYKDNLVMITRVKKSISLLRFFSTIRIQQIQRQTMEYDVLVVGGGVAGLSTAIKIKQLSSQFERPISVCVIEKGNEVGDHILSGNCFQTRAFDELFPNWRQFQQQKRPPIDTPVVQQSFHILTNDKSSINVPHFLFPSTILNYGNYVISLSKLTKWMGDQATQLGVDIFPGTPGADLIYDQYGSVNGVITGDFGISKTGQIKENFQPGIQIKARQTVFAEGARGSLTEKVIQRYKLRQQSDPPKYGIGLKEVWQVDNQFFKPGFVQHTVGWPLSHDVYGGSFLYHMKPNIIHVGLVVGLNYKNPYINPYQQFQRMKLHPQIRKYLEGGQCLSYGARALNSNGFFSIPKFIFPGGLLVGCSAGFMNVLKIKGSHNAIKSGLQAGSAIFEKITQPSRVNEDPRMVQKYEINLKKSWLWSELRDSRNFKNSFKNLYTGLAYGGFFKVFRGKEPFNLRSKVKDSDTLQTADKFEPIQYPKPDRKLTFDLLQNLARSGTNHDHDQPSHLVVKKGKQNKPAESLRNYLAPEERFCPAKVYEFVEDDKGDKKLQINAQNCLHCKTCSIKMVDEYIEWKTPEGNGGPKYNLM